MRLLVTALVAIEVLAGGRKEEAAARCLGPDRAVAPGSPGRLILNARVTEIMTLKGAILLLLSLIALPAWAQSDAAAELAQLRTELARIQQEQQSVYQQFQMLQQLRNNQVQAPNPQVVTNPAVYPDGEPPSYDDLARAQQEREDRIQEYDAKLEQLGARYKALEDEKKPILDRVQELTGQ